MFLKLLLLSSILLSIAAIGFGIRMLIGSHDIFPETHISRNKEMKKRGIVCARQNDIGCNPTDAFPECTSCNEKWVLYQGNWKHGKE
jgi:hypothetical protein